MSIPARFILASELHPYNIFIIEVTLDVSSTDRSKYVRDLQSPNISVISLTLLVFRPERSTLVSELHELNKKLISFDEIPSDLVNTIKDSVSKVLYREEAINSNVDLKDFMML